MRLALAQVDPVVGDLDGNRDLILARIHEARAAGVDLVVFPELAVTGYPPEDLLLRGDFLAAVREGVEEIGSSVEGIVAAVGFPERAEREHARFHDPIIDPPLPPAFNSVAVLADGALQGTYRKIHLPNYGVFDERRYFEPGREAANVDVDGAVVGLTICEDLWVPGSPEADEADCGAQLIVNASASPYHRGKIAAREAMLAGRARDLGTAVALCNTVGGQDELVFDGSSVIIAPDGTTLARGRQFEEELLVCDLLLPALDEPGGDGAGAARGRQAHVPTVAELRSGAQPDGHLEHSVAVPLGEEAEVYAALALGLRDYVQKNGFEHVVVALSGGIDSALVVLLAVDALGPERVTAVIMPSPYSRPESQADAHTIAANLGIEAIEMPIEAPMRAYEQSLEQSFEGTEPGIAEENIQARIRGNLVMALSNKFRWLVLTTGNKSEMSVGYATLYGDMAGGLAVIKDVFKTLVYRLVAWRNETAGRELVPRSVLERPPSAELKEDQKDEDSLPPYAVLDRILEGYVERDQGPDELVAEGLPADLVQDVLRLVDRAEYKRRQAPPSIRVSTKAFGRDRRLPITNRFGSMRPLPR